MNKNHWFKLRHFLWLLLALPLAAPAQQNLVDLLREGGYNIYFRHEATDWNQDDLVTRAGDWESCDGREIRQLSEAGRQRAAQTGRAMRALNIPVNEVLASPYCRTMDTARQFGLGEVKASTAVINLRVADYFGGRGAVVKTAQKLLATPPAPGGNRVIVAHGNVAQAATPVYPGEGEAVVFKPDGQGGFSAAGTIPPKAWKHLVAGAGKP